VCGPGMKNDPINNQKLMGKRNYQKFISTNLVFALAEKNKNK
jgi:hypothetical protein